MDIAITKKKASHVKRYLIVFFCALVLILVAKYLWFLGQADINIEKNTLVFSEVQRGTFSVSVRGTGLLVPNNIQWLSTNVDATVKRVVLKAGNIVKAGDLIVELSNPQLTQQLVEAQWELAAMNAELHAEQVAQESLFQQQKSNQLSINLDYERNVNEYNAYTKIIKTGAVSQLAYDKARIEMNQSKQRDVSSQEQLKKTKESLIAQNKARVARLTLAQKRLERLQQQVDDLHVKATMDSIILDMPLEAGERISMGTNVAKLAEQNSLIAELKVPELQIRDVVVGQKVIVDTRNNKINGVVSRVDPAVVNGNVQVDVVFSESLPNDARPDLSVDGVINITEIADALYVDRPLFAQSKSTAMFYKLDKSEQFAEKVTVALGDGSVNQIQVISGLHVGEKIVTSDPTRFQTYNKFRIN